VGKIVKDFINVKWVLHKWNKATFFPAYWLWSSAKKATVITTVSPQKQNNKFAIKARKDLLGMGLKL